MTDHQPGLPPATAAWREGDPAAWRRFLATGPLRTELGGGLPDVVVAYETWGSLNDDADNVVLVHHALTGDAHVTGTAAPGQPTPGWWDGIVGPGRAIDTDRWFVICANVLGGCQGTTGPASPAGDGRPYGSRFPRITIRDQVAVESRLLMALGIREVAAVLGGSMGGMRALEWLVEQPLPVRSGVLLATGARATADQIATQTAQIACITADPQWRGGNYHDAPAGRGPHVGMGLARRFAHLTYRSESDLDLRFGVHVQPGEEPLGPVAAGVSPEAGRFAIQSYLDHHADKLARRFDAGTYVALTDAMNTHDVGRGRGGIAAALSRVAAPVTIAGITSDRLYPLRQQEELARLISTASDLVIIDSAVGHDAFLTEIETVSQVISESLGLLAPTTT